MEKIIQHLCLDLGENILKKAFCGELSDLDAFSGEVLDDCKACAIQIVTAVVEALNHQLRDRKAERKEAGLVLKEKDRPRTLLTPLGEIHFSRDYYYSKPDDRHEAVLDKMLGIEPYSRIGQTICSQLLTAATKHSYAESSKIVTNGFVSRQTVHDIIQRAPILENSIPDEKRNCKALHIFVDEDHVHLQKPFKRKGKQSVIVPLITVTEGTSSVCLNRNQTVHPRHFVSEKLSTKGAWKSAVNYVWEAYDMDKTDVYVYGDGASWIKTGVEAIPNAQYVIDGFHFKRDLRLISKLCSKFGLSKRIELEAKTGGFGNIPKLFEEFKKSVPKESVENVEKFQTYVMNNWHGIVNMYSDRSLGSCTEAQVSHVLSERFSRNPMGWSKWNIGRLSKARTYVLNGGEITPDMLKNRNLNLSEYQKAAEDMLRTELGGSFDWSIFTVEASNATAWTSYGRSENGARFRILN